MIINRVVLDTNIFVSALLTPKGKPAQIYRMFLEGTLSLVFSMGIFEEYQDVLRRAIYLDTSRIFGTALIH